MITIHTVPKIYYFLIFLCILLPPKHAFDAPQLFLKDKVQYNKVLNCFTCQDSGTSVRWRTFVSFLYRRSTVWLRTPSFCSLLPE